MIAFTLGFLLNAIDPFLGRIDKQSFSQQTLMEMLIDGITNRENITGSTEEPSELKGWKGLSVNDKEEVTEIHWPFSGLEGSLTLECLPLTVLRVKMFTNKLTGSIDITSLPPPMRQLELQVNELTGEISFQSLPEEMEKLDLSFNKLSGGIDLTNLPVQMKELYLEKNDFAWKAVWSELPKSLRFFRISEKRLSREIFGEDGKYYFQDTLTGEFHPMK